MGGDGSILAADYALMATRVIHLQFGSSVRGNLSCLYSQVDTPFRAFSYVTTSPRCRVVSATLALDMYGVPIGFSLVGLIGLSSRIGVILVVLPLCRSVLVR